MTVAEAIHLLHVHKHSVYGIGGRPGRTAGRVPMEEVRDEILHKLEVIRPAERRDAGVKARAEREWAARRR